MRTLSRKTATKPPEKPKTWRHGLCECCEDPALACSVCLFGCNATGQAYQRATGSGCFAVSIFLWGLFILSQVMNSTSNGLNASAYADEKANVDEEMVSVSIVGGLAGFFGLISSIATTYFVCTSRRIMRERDEIPDGCCGGCDDCCTGWWCSCCALIQMFRQDSITGNRYRACAEEAV